MTSASSRNCYAGGKVRALAAFLPLFEAPGFVFGKWHKSEREEPGVFVMPYFEPGETAVAFVRMAYDQGWVLMGWGWPGWMGTEKAPTRGGYR